jgi:hypothetical protein
MKKVYIYGQECLVCNGCKNLNFRKGECNRIKGKAIELNSVTNAAGYKNYLTNSECNGTHYIEEE